MANETHETVEMAVGSAHREHTIFLANMILLPGWSANLFPGIHEYSRVRQTLITKAKDEDFQYRNQEEVARMRSFLGDASTYLDRIISGLKGAKPDVRTARLVDAEFGDLFAQYYPENINGEITDFEAYGHDETVAITGAPMTAIAGEAGEPTLEQLVGTIGFAKAADLPGTIGFARAEDLPGTIVRRPEPTLVPKSDETVVGKRTVEPRSYETTAVAVPAKRRLSDYFSNLGNRLLEIDRYDVGKPFREASKWALGAAAITAGAVAVIGAFLFYNELKPFEEKVREGLKNRPSYSEQRPTHATGPVPSMAPTQSASPKLDATQTPAPPVQAAASPSEKPSLSDIPTPLKPWPVDPFGLQEGKLPPVPYRLPSDSQEEGRVEEYVVEKGDWRGLWGIAQKKLGDGKRWKEIYNASGLTSTVIHPGDVLKLYHDGGRKMRTVASGHTLSQYALEEYGDAKMWKRLFDANPQMHDRKKGPHDLRVGDVIIIPPAERSSEKKSEKQPENKVSGMDNDSFNLRNDIFCGYSTGNVSARQIAKGMKTDTDEVYRMLDDARKATGKTYSWAKGRRMAEATGEAGYIRELVKDYRGSGLTYRAIAEKIKRETGFAMSASTASRMYRSSALAKAA